MLTHSILRIIRQIDGQYTNAPLLAPSLAWAEARDILAGVERKIDCQVLALMPFLSLPDVGIYCSGCK